MEILTEQEAATLLRCSTKSLQRARAAGDLAFIRGRPVKIRLSDLLNYIEKKVQTCPTKSKNQNLSKILPESSRSALASKQQRDTVAGFALRGRLAAMKLKRI